MSKAVLCALDITNDDQDAAVLEMAKKLADLQGAQLDVITVVPDYGMSVVAGYFKDGHHDKIVAAAHAEMEKMVIRVIGAEANAKVRHVVATGKAYDEILRTARVDDAGLIVIGAHKPDFKDYLLGPNAARVVRHASCSVFVVRS